MITTKTRTLAFVLATTFTMLVAAPVANAVNINLNIYRSQTSGPQAGLVGPAGGLGETWNQFSTTSATNLLDSAGAPTSVGYTSGGNSWGGPDTWGNPTLGLIRDGLRNFDTNPTTTTQNLHINGLVSDDVYDVWIASANTSGQHSQGEWTMTNPTTSATVQTADNTGGINGATWELGNNYVLFKNVVVDGGGEIVLTGHARRDNTFDTRLPLNGFQLVEVVAAVPEPSTLILLGTGLLGLLANSRRKRRRV